MSEIYIYNEVTVPSQPDIKKFIDNELTVTARKNVPKFIESELTVFARLDVKKFLYAEIIVNPNPSKRQTIISDAQITHSRRASVLSDAKIKVLGRIETILSDAVIAIRNHSDILSDAFIFRQPKQTITSNANIFHPHANITSDASILRTYIRNILSNARILVHHKLKFLTNFTTKLRIFKTFTTQLTTAKNRQIEIYASNFVTKLTSNREFNTDFRTRIESYDSINPKSLSDIIVKKDGVILPDVDYNSLQISFVLNRTPSNATFTLARHHDDLDHDLDGNISEISSENLIQIFDGTILLFTGYITRIEAVSSTDTVRITAEDRRYILESTSDTIEWGCKYENGKISQVPINVPISQLGGPGLGSSFCPEWNSQTGDIGSLLDTLICNTGNNNWFIDENENVGLQKVSQGAIKTLSLSSINQHRHLYDVILNDITLNKVTSDYTKSLLVKLGTNHVTGYIFWDAYGRNYNVTWDSERQTWDTSDAERLVTKDMNYLKSSHYFEDMFIVESLEYVGQTPIFDAHTISTGLEVVGVTYKLQYKFADYLENGATFIVGSGSPQKSLDLSEYGGRYDTWRMIGDDYGLYVTIDDTYNYSNFAGDLANFTLSQNNKLLTEATVTLTLDAFEYYGLNFNSLINLSNTISANCYSNNNGFPLNISSYSINCANRTVTLNLTNYGKTYYQRNGFYLKNFYPGKTVKWYSRYKPQ